MNEPGHIFGGCLACGHVFDMYNEATCPNCRIEKVKQAFKPVDALRTALGMGTLTTGIDWDSEKWKDIKERADKTVAKLNEEIPGSFRVTKAGNIVELNYKSGFERVYQGEDEPEDTPWDCKIPVDEASQVYELKRRFRL